MMLSTELSIITQAYMNQDTLTALYAQRRTKMGAAAASYSPAEVVSELLVEGERLSTLPPWKADASRHIAAILRLCAPSTPLSSQPGGEKLLRQRMSLAATLLLVFGALAGAAVGGALATTVGALPPLLGGAAGVVIIAVSLWLAHRFYTPNDLAGNDQTAHLCEAIDKLFALQASALRQAQSEEAELHPAISLEGTYCQLLEALQELVGYKAAEGEAGGLARRVDGVANSLGNYGLAFVGYNGQNAQLFDMQPSTDGTTRMVWPALCRGNVALLRGKVFVKQ